MTRRSQFGMTRLYERPAPAWHAEAIRLREAGWPFLSIAVELGHEESTVRWVLDENGEQRKHYERVRRARKARAA